MDVRLLMRAQIFMLNTVELKKLDNMTNIDTALYVHKPSISYICTDLYTDMIVIVSVAWFWPDDVN